MFSVSIYLGGVPSLSGCESLDFCRRYGLEDRVRVGPTTHIHHHTLSVPVGEAFARAHFPPSRITQVQAVPVSLCLHGETAYVQHYDYDRISFADLPAERIIALFLAARALEARQEIARLTARVQELEAAEESTDE